jgi:ribonuclease HII
MKQSWPDFPNLQFETNLWKAGLRWVAGVDEAGRGALAGPVAAGAVIFSPHPDLEETLHGVRDSKQMTPASRKVWADKIKTLAAAWAVGFASPSEIDGLGIVPATRLAILRALQNLTIPPQHLLLDYLTLPDCPYPQTALVKGDRRSLSIAAASVLAKTSRDAQMVEYERQYPGYGFAVHKGYATAFHRQQIALRGASPLHRCSFAPLCENHSPAYLTRKK